MIEMNILLIFLAHIVVVSSTYVTEKNILSKILANYNTGVRPQEVEDKPVHVNFDMRLKKITGLDIKHQVLKIEAFIVQRWEDPQLKWNKTKFNGTDRVNVGNLEIWTPDVVLYNTADEISRLHTDIYTSKCLVFSHGQVVMRNLVTWRVSCSFDVTWFPVDKQICNISFGSWSYSKSQLKVKFWSKPSGKDEVLSSYFLVDNGEWDINSLIAFEEEILFTCCPEPFSSIIYQLTVSRVSLYYFMYILLPLISLAFLFLLVFHIPADSGERMGFGVTILLSITVYLLVISEKLPEKSDNVPMLGVCFITIFYILITALAMAALTTILARRETMPPYWLTRLTTIGCFKIDVNNFITSTSKVNIKNSTIHVRKFSGLENNGNDMELKDNNNPEPEPSPENVAQNHNAKWVKICRVLDKRLFIFYAVLIFLIPIIITASLPTDALGST